MWRSGLLSIPAAKLPLRFKFVANGHRHSPNTRPLIWDSASRVVDAIPEDGCGLESWVPGSPAQPAAWSWLQGAVRTAPCTPLLRPLLALPPARPRRSPLGASTSRPPAG